MNRRQHLTLSSAALAVALAVGLGSALPVARADPRTAGDAVAIMDSYVARAAASSGPGLTMALLKDGAVVHTAAAGHDGQGASVGVETPMRVESVSKSFTALAVMQLAERGRIRLDEPVQRQLPEFTLDDPAAGQITVRQLLTHSSGLDDAHGPDPYAPGVGTLPEAVSRLSTARLASPPGHTFAYTNANYHVLARLVEVRSGRPFAAYLADEVFAPAGMTRTVSVARSDQRVPGMAAGHLTAFGRAVPYEGAGYFTEGSGGVISTATDLGRWLALQSRGGRSVTGRQVLSSAGIAEMHRPQSPGDSDYGLGWYTAESAEGPPLRTSHSGAGAGFGAYQGLFTDSGWAVAVLVNHGAGLTAADPAALGQNLLADIDPQIPALEARGSGLVTDLVLSVLIVATAVWTIWSVQRAPGWAHRRRQGWRWVTPVLLLPQLVAIVFVLGVPTLQLLLTQRIAGWGLLFAVEPVAVILLAVLGVGSAAVVTARSVNLLRRRS